MSAHEIEAKALQLPREQRAALAQQLIASLDEHDESGHVEQAWATEAMRRYEGLRADRDEQAWSDLSLRSALRGMEDEDGPEYSEADLTERFS